MKIYVVDNGGQWTHREWRVLRDLGVETKIIPNTLRLSEIDADGLILSGGAARISLENQKLGNISEYLSQAKIPILAICVSHQFLAIHFGGSASAAAVPEFGKVEISIEQENELFNGLPKKFVAWQSHNDEIKKLPECFVSLARSENCAHEAIKHKTKPFYGLQFHPEVEQTEHGYEIFKNFIRICEDHAKTGKHILF